LADGACKAESKYIGAPTNGGKYRLPHFVLHTLEAKANPISIITWVEGSESPLPTAKSEPNAPAAV